MSVKKILIIDDSLMIRTTMAACLKKAGKEVIAACDGQEAMNIIESTHDLDLIFLDVNMPVLDGFEMLESIKHQQNSEEFNIPVVMLTTENKSHFLEEIKEFGIQEWLEKPVDFNQVLAVLNKYE